MTFGELIDATGTAVADLPAGAGTMARPPEYTCYLLYQSVATGALVWAQVGDQFGRQANPTASCTVGQAPGLVNLRVTLAGGVTGQGYAIVVVY